MIVVCSIATTTIILCGALAGCLLLGVKPDPIVFTAFGTITGQVVGSLTSLLANTRTTPGTDADMPKAEIVSNKPIP